MLRCSLYFNLVAAEMHRIILFWLSFNILKAVWYQLKNVLQIHCVLQVVWRRKEFMDFEKMWSLNTFCVKAIQNYSQFGPHTLLFCWLYEEFWQWDFSFVLCMLAVGKNCNTHAGFLAWVFLSIFFYYFLQSHFFIMVF